MRWASYTYLETRSEVWPEDADLNLSVVEAMD